MFVLAPDLTKPPWFDALDGIDPELHHRILWVSFRDIADQISATISDPSRLLGEQTRFLLAELAALYESDGLLTADDTVVVAARAAWPEYQEHGAYVCQPDRTFRDGLTHFGFYAKRAIQPLVPQIRQHYSSVPFSRLEATVRRAAGDNELANVIERFLDAGLRLEGDAQGVLILSPADDPKTEKLDAPVANDTVTAAGRPWAWTLGQRYTRLKALKNAAVTSDL